MIIIDIEFQVPLQKWTVRKLLMYLFLVTSHCKGHKQLIMCLKRFLLAAQSKTLTQNM